ncbi:hypothetical protein FKM82_030657 [Ascaphus truei]
MHREAQHCQDRLWLLCPLVVTEQTADTSKNQCAGPAVATQITGFVDRSTRLEMILLYLEEETISQLESRAGTIPANRQTAQSIQLCVKKQ